MSLGGAELGPEAHAMRTCLLAVIAPILLALAGPAFATDGVAEINHTCAVNMGCHCDWRIRPEYCNQHALGTLGTAVDGAAILDAVAKVR